MIIASRSASIRRRGFGLIELMAAGVVFAALVLMTLQVTSWVVAERRAAARREAAALAASNLMERVLIRPWGEMTPEGLAPLAEAANRDRPPGSARVAIEVGAEPPIDGIGQKRVIVEFAWPDRARVPEAPVRLIAWTYERKERP